MAVRVARFFLLFLVAIGLFGCDHATKFAAKASLEGTPGVPLALGGAVELRYAQNDDIAFSALHQLGLPRSQPLLVGVGIVAVLGIVAAVLVVRRRSRAEGVLVPSERSLADRANAVAIALILGGALGNLVDRIVRGYVVDFIHIRGWPIFNVADIAVVAGAILLGLGRFRAGRSRGGPSPTAPGSTSV